MECPVCFEIYETPLLLPGCGHTICRTCAEALITEGNFLRCPECRLVYQLRQGIKSLPKNVALERTIDEQTKSPYGNRLNPMCDDHPDDAVALYCKTCEKSICLKCYFTGTIRRGQVSHTGHQVDTSEDAVSKEKRKLEEKRREYGEKRDREREYVANLEKTEEKLKELLEEKTAEIEKHKTDIISQVKQTSNKLKFTLKGSMVRDSEFLQMSLVAARDRLEQLEELVSEADDELKHAAAGEKLEVNMLKETRRKLDNLGDPCDTDRPIPDSFLKISNFDTDVNACLDDPKKALSYQTEAPRMPQIMGDECVVSDTSVYIAIKYNETVRVKTLTLYYKEAMYKGFSEKQWTSLEIKHFTRGLGNTVLKNLKRGSMYRMYCVSSNDFGDSSPSTEIWFRTVNSEVELRTT